jgi:hypothetical protein
MRSNFLLVARQRLRRSWTRWSRKRALRRLARERHRLLLLQELLTDQADRVQELTRQLHQVSQARPVPQMVPVELPTPEPPPLLRATPTLPPPPEPEEMPDPAEEIAQLLGLPAQQT